MRFANPWRCDEPRKFFNQVHRSVIIDSAKKRRLNVTRISNALFTISSTYKTHTFFNHAVDLTSHTARLITKSKHITKICLDQAGVCTPAGSTFQKSEIDKAWGYAQHIGMPVVIKPLSGTGGTGVTSNILSRELFEVAWNGASRSQTIVVEKHIQGDDHRLLVAGSSMIAAAIREPASIVGDGTHKISELIDKKNKIRQENPYYGTKKIRLTPSIKFHLGELGLSADCVLSEGQKILLHPVANIGMGGESIDVTEDVHPEFSKIAIRALKAIPGMFHGGIDLIAPDISKHPDSQTWAVIESNSVPDLAMHHFPTHGTPRDAAGALLDILFDLPG